MSKASKVVVVATDNAHAEILQVRRFGTRSNQGSDRLHGADASELPRDAAPEVPGRTGDEIGGHMQLLPKKKG